MEHKHIVRDSDARFVINPVTKAVKSTAKNPTIAQYSHNSERITFEIPRLVEEHDMSSCTSVEIHYQNIDAKTKEYKSGYYEAEDLQVDPNDSEKVICSWLISGNGTQLAGLLNFTVWYICKEDGVITYAFPTILNSELTVGGGFKSSELVITEYVDVIEQWKQSVMDYFKTDITAWKDETATAMKAEVKAEFGQEIDVERKRIDNLVSGDTVDDAEVLDIRVGTDGVTYESAGAAVRTQISNMAEKLRNAKVAYDEYLVVINGYYVQDTGKLFENESYAISEAIHLPAGYTVTFTARGYKTAVAMIARLNADGTYTPLVNSVSSEVNAYTYTTSEEIDLVFSWSESRGYSLHINVDIADVVSALSDQATAQITAAITQAKNRHIAEDYVSLSLFSKFGVIGDSYASGEMYFDENFHDIYEVSWGQILARKLGTDCVNFSGGGYSTRGWLNNSKGLALLLNTEAQDIYYLCLGINDANYYGADYLGTVADINEDFSLNPDTFFGNYGKIIGNIKEHAPKAKIVMSTMVPTTDMKATYNEAIIEIAKHFGVPFIVQTEDPFFTSDLYVDGKVQSHPVAVVYSGMAVALERLLKRCIIENFEYFKDAYMY